MFLDKRCLQKIHQGDYNYFCSEVTMTFVCLDWFVLTIRFPKPYFGETSFEYSVAHLWSINCVALGTCPCLCAFWCEFGTLHAPYQVSSLYFLSLLPLNSVTHLTSQIPYLSSMSIMLSHLFVAIFLTTFNYPLTSLDIYFMAL